MQPGGINGTSDHSFEIRTCIPHCQKFELKEEFTLQLHHNISKLPAFRNAVVTIGTFDGVHTGHKHILNQQKSEAQRISGETVIITFHPHPRKIVSHTHEVQLLNTLEEKIEILSKEGIDHLVVVPFTEAFAEQTAESYIKNFLVRNIHPHTIIIGYDHRFGKDRAGNYLMLEKYAAELGFGVKEIPEKVLNEIAVSSTRIRKAIKEGDIESANALLGYDYFFEANVVAGNKLGRTIGYPTANLHVENPEKLIPGNGVYAVEIKIGEQFFKGMMNIGFRPTVDGSKMVIEVNIFDFDRDIYHTGLRVHVKYFLRPEQKFNGLDALKIQLGKDRLEALAKLK
ncbi:bifunctional riboflavin kinase/FAD synthetase [Agriterribacter sp.]|uniref:bifunctional riboflavin kinase/FAD synthetase n=1 Tax=Agriterribacter sp. TaxID=2821509 RepID=UPI002CEA5CDB|nr:bifunctional riboflavin kinase/FAD synthetase [Agriterribacter sp.]HRP56573.1 bifunctional riboflavin kinase/FAD synthetase [Agriterribacter sp.]